MNESSPPEDLGDAGAARHQWDALIGPFYDEPSLAALLRVSPVTIDRLVADAAILCTTTEDGTKLYPAFQFGPGGELLPGLSTVLAVLRRAGSDDWGHALWLKAPVERFEGRSATDLLSDGDLARAVSAAERDAASWSK